ncbi:uncharacterized protein LOC115224071 [Argonauta hians]
MADSSCEWSTMIAKPNTSDNTFLKNLKCCLNKPYCSSHNLFVIIGCICLLTSVVLSVAHLYPQSNGKHHFYQSFSLVTTGYPQNGSATYLQWQNDPGLVKHGPHIEHIRCILLPNKGIYHINLAVQMAIPKEASPFIVTLMLVDSEGNIIETSKTSILPLYFIRFTRLSINLAYEALHKVSVCVKMNQAKYISSVKKSSHFIISSSLS